MKLKQSRKILVLRFSSIGDIVLTSPVLRALKQQTEAEIHFLTKCKFHELVAYNPHVAKVWTFDRSPMERCEELRRENFDWVIDLHKNLRSIRLSWSLKKPTVRFNKLNFRKWLMVWCKVNFLPKQHLVDRYFEALKPHEISNDGFGLDFFIKSDSQWPEGIPDRYIVGVLGATYSTKQIPLALWSKIIERINDPLVVIGGDDVAPVGHLLKQKFESKVINQAGILNLFQSAMVIRNAQFVITPDTGMMHVSAALRKPMHIFWGNTIPDFGMYPYYGQDTVSCVQHEVRNLGCRPCSKLGYADCPKGHFKCMMNQELTGL